MTYSIEKAKETDLPQILAIQKRAYQQEAELYNDFSIQPLQQNLESTQKEWQAGTILKAMQDGRIIGSVRAHETDSVCFIGKLIVEPSNQNNGIGRALLAAIEQHFSSAVRYELFTGHRSEKNIALYKKCGYTAYKTEKATSNLQFVFLQKHKLS